MEFNVKHLTDLLKQNMVSLLFGIFTAVWLICYLIGPETEFSEFENRFLTQRPSLKLSDLADGSFMKSFESYTEDQLPLREPFIRLKSVIERAELKKENNGIVRGKDGQLFEKLLSYNKNLSRNEDIIAAFLEKTERGAYVGIIPNSMEIQKDRLPSGLPNVSEKEAIDEFYDKLLDINDCKTVDLYDMLSLHKGEEIYYHTDHHWTTLGAYYGYQALCGEMGLKGVSLSDLSFETAEGFYGTYYSKYKGIGIKPDEISFCSTPALSYVNQDDGTPHDGLYDMDKLSAYDKYAMFMYGNPGMAVIECSDNNTGRSLLLLKDSYSNCLIPFLTYDYDKITVIDLRYYGGKLSETLEKNSEADLLLLYNFMHLSEDSNFYKLLK